MEIEAKFVVPDEPTHQHLQDVTELAGYTLSPARTKHYQDTYLDTEERALSARLFVCRRRASLDGSPVITVKGPGTAQGAVHRREEYEVEVLADSPPDQWPDSEACKQVLSITRDAALVPFLGLEQVRQIRSVNREVMPVAKWSLDEVTLEADDGRVQHYYELELELKENGTEMDLEILSTAMVSRWQLAPQPRSKFEPPLPLLSMMVLR